MFRGRAGTGGVCACLCFSLVLPQAACKHISVCDGCGLGDVSTPGCRQCWVPEVFLGFKNPSILPLFCRLQGKRASVAGNGRWLERSAVPTILAFLRHRGKKQIVEIFICSKTGLFCGLFTLSVLPTLAPAQTRFATACGWRWRVLARLLWGIARALHSGGRGVAGGAARGRHGRRHAPVAGR